MKKTVSLLLTAMLAAQVSRAQVKDGIKYLNYDKNMSAKEAFQKAYDSNPKDPEATFWLGQAMLALATDEGDTPKKDQLDQIKNLYQKGLQDAGSAPLLLIGMGQIEILEGGDLNSAKQKFEQAITATTPTRGRNKGKPDADILNAIGYVMAQVPINKGDHAYAVEKLKQAATEDEKNPDIMINMGINYLKMGGENGGEAVKAYQEALNRDPKSALAYYRIGKIYQSQNNKDLFEMNFDKAIEVDPAFPPVYNAYYEYYSDKDVNKAKEYLDKYVASADKDPRNDLYLADYLFRAGKYQESLDKLKTLEGIGDKALPKIDILYALDFDRLGDSVQAKSYLTKYFANAPTNTIAPSDYELAVKVFSKFPGSENETIVYLQKAIDNDTSKVNKLKYMSGAAEMFGKAKNYEQQVVWLEKAHALKGGKMDEYDHFQITRASLESKNYAKTIELAKSYMQDYPDKPQPYAFFKRAAMESDPDTTTGTAAMYLNYLDSVLTVIDKEKHKREIFLNEYYIINYYVKRMTTLKNSEDFKITTDGQRTPTVDEYLATCQKAIAVAENMIAAYPDPNDDNNKYAQNAKASIQKAYDYYSNPPKKGENGGSSSGAKGQHH